MATQTAQRHDRNDNDSKSPLKWVLIALAVLAVLLLLAFGLGWIDVASDGGSVDVEAPESDVELDGPDVDVDVDGELQGDADAEVTN